MPHDPELEVRLRQPRPGEFAVELYLDDPDDQGEKRSQVGQAALDPAALLEVTLEPQAYGRLLGAQLFADPEVLARYREVQALVGAGHRTLRWRLDLPPDDPLLQGLRWELLADPITGQRLSTSERVLFSRFLASGSWRRVPWKSRSEIRVLVAAAGPEGQERFRLSPVDAGAELARVARELGALRAATLGDRVPCTLLELTARLREGVDWLYLVCHGTLAKGEPHLLLEDEGRQPVWVRGAELGARLAELQEPPRLVVLASCESAGREDGSSEGALARHLIEAGVSAVLAMSGKISKPTVAAFMPIFFRELQRDGRVDRAAALARGAVRDADDGWMPILYTQLKNGRLWYEAGFDEGGFDRWRSLAAELRKGLAVPILGPGYAEHIVGSAGERARRLARQERIWALQDCGDLARVAQYLSIKESRRWLIDHLRFALRDEIAARHPDLPVDAGLADAVTRRHLAEGDPLEILAGLPVRLFVSAAQDSLLPRALKAKGREPAKATCQWRRTVDHHLAPAESPTTPTAAAPMVFYPFGNFEEPASLVLTEDDFLDFTIAAAQYRLIPNFVQDALLGSSLLFLGFTLDELSFRTLFRSILSLEGSHLLKDFAHVGVQIDPQSRSEAEIEQARHYLKKYFDSSHNPTQIYLYWGSVADFLAELKPHLDADTTPAAETDAWF